MARSSLSLFALLVASLFLASVLADPFDDWCQEYYYKDSCKYPTTAWRNRVNLNSDHVNTYCLSSSFTCKLNWYGDNDVQDLKGGIRNGLAGDVCDGVDVFYTNGTKRRAEEAHERREAAMQQTGRRQTTFSLPSSCQLSISDQLDCASCYIPPVLGAVQAAMCYNHPSHVNPGTFSMQQVLDCSENAGCNGGSHGRVLRYLFLTRPVSFDVASPYLFLESQYPYNGQVSPWCQSYNYQNPVSIHQISGFQRIHSYKDIDDALWTVGSAIITWSAGDVGFVFYSSGEYDGNPSSPSACSKIINHLMLVVGSTSSHFVVHNSWGTQWGNQGKMDISRVNEGKKDDENMCGMLKGAVSLIYTA